jgi:hypothetical protein
VAPLYATTLGTFDAGSKGRSTPSFLMKFAGDCGSSTENRRHADRLSNFIARTEWFGGKREADTLASEFE